jgi:hypothetical protein
MAARMAMMAMTTSNSMSVNRRFPECDTMAILLVDQTLPAEFPCSAPFQQSDALPDRALG